MNRISTRLLPLAALALLAAAACGKDGDDADAGAPPTDTAAMPAPPPAPEAAAPGVTDPQIAGIVVGANAIDIEAGELAKEKGENAKVREFAQRMITDHTAVNQQASDLAGRLGVTPEESPTSRQLRQGADQNMANLRGLSGAAFDRAYIDHEVEYHQTVLSAIDETLIPGAQNAELRDLLTRTRPAIQAHLDHAKQIQAELGS
jgi:putative membrane protein